MIEVIHPDADSDDWFERACAQRGLVIADGIAWAHHAAEHARWFGKGKIQMDAAPKRRAMTDSQRECLGGDV